MITPQDSGYRNDPRAASRQWSLAAARLRRRGRAHRQTASSNEDVRRHRNQGEDRAGKFVTEVNDGRIEPITATVGQLLDEWLEAASVTQRPRTLEENRRKINHRIRPKLGSRETQQADAGAA